MSEGSDGGSTSPNQLWNLGVFLLKVPGFRILKKEAFLTQAARAERVILGREDLQHDILP